jgi:hypothetical protein
MLNGDRTAKAPGLSRRCHGRTPSPEGLTIALLSAPSSLPVTVLEWLSHHLLYCAAPPYSLRWDEQSRKT